MGGERRPMTNDTTNRIKNTTNKTQAISEAINWARNKPNAPAIKAITKNTKEYLSMIVASTG
jgi:hypothetical protein